MNGLFGWAARVDTPLALGGLFAAAFFFVVKLVLARSSRAAKGHRPDRIQRIVDRLLVLSLVAAILGVAAYAFVASKSRDGGALSVVRLGVQLHEGSRKEAGTRFAAEVRTRGEIVARVTDDEAWATDSNHGFEMDLAAFKIPSCASATDVVLAVSRSDAQDDFIEFRLTTIVQYGTLKSIQKSSHRLQVIASGAGQPVERIRLDFLDCPQKDPEMPPDATE